MTIPLTGSGGLFGRLGAIFGGAADLYALQGGTATARVLATASWQTRIGTLETDYTASPNDLLLLTGDNGFGQSATPLNQTVNSWINNATGFASALATLAQNTLVKMADQDAGGLQQRTVTSALTYLVNQMNTGLAAPAAPTLVGSGTGGTMAAGVYKVVITYTNAFGETVPSSSASVTLSGTTSSLTIDSPATETGATNWYAYVTQPGGSTYTRQQAAGSPTLIGTNLVLTAPPTSTGLAPPPVNTAIASTVNASTISIGSQTNVGVPNGNPVIVLSGVNGKGQTHQYSYNETITFACSADAQTGSATAGQELLSVTGQASATTTSYSWPAGSGVAISVNAVSSLTNNSNGNVLQNSSFDTQTTTNIPDNWTIATGTAGTQVVAGGSSNAYLGTNSVGLVGDSSTLTAITQLFSQAPSTTVGAGGTLYKPLPWTPYAVNGWVKLSAASPAAGVLQIDLIDGSGNILNDYSDNQNSATVNLHSIADTNWHNFNAVFRLPTVLPTQVKLRLWLSTALSTGTTAYIDAVAMNPMTQFYNGGPFVSVFSGNTNMIQGDTWTLAYTVTWGAVQQWMQRWFNLSSLNMRLPASTVSPTVPDSVVA